MSKDLGGIATRDIKEVYGYERGGEAC